MKLSMVMQRFQFFKMTFRAAMLVLGGLSSPFLVAQVKTETKMPAPKTELVIPPFRKMPERFVKYPLKTKRMIFQDKDIALANLNAAKYPEAKKVKDEIIKAASYWLDWNDTDLRDLLADARVPRAFDLNPKGSPVHGDAVFKKAGPYPWIVDPRHPLQVKSPIDGQMFPSNNYMALYKSDFKLTQDSTADYFDDGWGWTAPDGERYWFVAYANQWTWKNFIEPAFLNLGRAYLLTGDKRFAHKAAVMLHRMAEVYPSMDHANQSRYGLISKSEGRTYNGKVLNLIWETLLIQNASEAYDAVWETIDGDQELQKFYGKNGESIRSFIEANLLEDALDAYMERKIQGNYGLHQSALIYILLARQNMDTEKYMHMLVDEPGATQQHMGLRYALYNMMFKDGMPFESPYYNMLTVEKLATLGEILKKGGTNLFTEPRLKMVFNGPPSFVVTGKFTPDVGDSGNSLGQVIGLNPTAYQIAYDHYKDPAYLTWLANVDKTGANSFSTFESLFRPVLPQTAPMPGGRAVPINSSRLFAGYGLGILNNPKDVTALSFNYGMKGTHYHWDFLNFELFANGQKMMPDLGYPDAMNEYVKEVYAWSTNTIAHNTVVVDAERQNLNNPGVLHNFANGKFARSMDASSPAYSMVSRYRRNLIMIDVDDKQSYVVDFFRVVGGKQHDYTLHGPPGKMTVSEGKAGPVRKGTFAGENVAFGDIYDDAVLGKPGYSLGYGKYHGSGFSYLYNVQKLEDVKTTLQYQHISDDKARLKIHLLPVGKQETFIADAFDKPRAQNNVLKYVIARRQSTENAPLSSTFVSVLEPYNSHPFIESTRLLKLDKGEGNAVEVIRANVIEIIISDTTNSAKIIAEQGIETDAGSALIGLDKSGNLQRVYFSDGTYLRYKGKSFKSLPAEGVVTSVDYKKQEVKVQFKANFISPTIPGSVAHFTNGRASNVHPVAKFIGSGKNFTLKTSDDLLLGKVRVKEVSAQSATTETKLPFAPLCAGTTILNLNFEHVTGLKYIDDRTLQWTGTPKISLKAGDDVFITDVAVGDKVVFKSNFSWESLTDKK